MSLDNNRRVVTDEYRIKAIESLKKKLAGIKANLERIDRFKNLINVPAWKDMEERWNSEKKNIEQRLYEFDELTERQILILLGQMREVTKMLSVRDLVSREGSFVEESLRVQSEIDKLEAENDGGK